MSKATARHILVDSETKCEELKQQIENGADFAQLAAEHSKCPSGQSGGDLGEFSPGQMVPEFDSVVFNDAVGEIHGPIATQFGYHLIEITSRSQQGTAAIMAIKLSKEAEERLITSIKRFFAETMEEEIGKSVA